MLIISRNVNDRVFIGENIVLTVVEITGGTVRLGIAAPKSVSISRDNMRAGKPANLESRSTTEASQKEANP